jgi:hypothetical protein
VLGYDRKGAEPDPEDSPSFADSSGMVRLAFAGGGFQWIAAAGKLAREGFGSAAFQGELFEWLGVRSEILFAQQLEADSRRFEISFGLEHRFESSLHLRFEQFYHGGGRDPEQYSDGAATGSLPYLGKFYSAFGLSYDFTELIVLDLLVLVNWADPSALQTLNLVYSFSEGAEIALIAIVPLGTPPSLGPPFEAPTITLESEFGVYPAILSGELRVYF